MLYPEFIKKGSKIGVPAPSSGAYDELKINKFNNAKLKIEKLGFETEISPNINTSKKYRSADAITRANEINKIFDTASNIDAVICATGGEFLVEILPYIDFDKIAQNPKWVQGFSDPTGLLFPITTKYDIATIYGNNFGSYGIENYDKSTLDSLKILQGEITEQDSYEFYEEESLEKVTGLEGDNLTEKVEWKILNAKSVNVNGRVIGGCLDIIMELCGTKYDGTQQFIEKYKNDGFIWYFDNCELSLEELIRSLWKLNELGYFKYAKAVIFGRNGSGVPQSPVYSNMQECLEDSILSKLNIPIICDADISHKPPCLNIINGAIATFYVADGKAKIKLELK